MGMYSYVLRYDDGAAPNPFYGYCTIAICKPAIRRVANFGDWIIGTGNAKIGNDKIVYAMKVTYCMDFQKYFKDNRFQAKIPRFDNFDKHCHLGDNIYKPTGNGFEQLPSVHSDGYKENLKNKLHDLGKNLHNNRILVSDHFYYFGDNAVDLPENLRFIFKKGQWHKSDFTNEQVAEFENFIKGLGFEPGIHGKPNNILTPEEVLDDTCIKCNKIIEED